MTRKESAEIFVELTNDIATNEGFTIIGELQIEAKKLLLGDNKNIELNKKGV